MHDARAEPKELPARVRAGEVAREVDDQDSAERLHAGGAISILGSLTDGSIAHRRKAEAHARRGGARLRAHGYHGSRVGDIAAEAGVAHGLLYHYFASKDEVLETIFLENFGELFGALPRRRGVRPTRGREARGDREDPPSHLAQRPDLVTVMVRDVARSPQLQAQVDEVREAFAIVQRVIEEGQAEGASGPDLDARLASWIFYGGLEEVLTGWVLGQLPDGDEEVARAEQTAIELALRGLAVRLARVKVFNLNGDEWDRVEEREGWRSKDAWVGAHVGAELIGGSMYELEPGDQLWPYHTHHANEEWMIVLRGRPTLRTPEGEQELARG